MGTPASSYQNTLYFTIIFSLNASVGVNFLVAVTTYPAKKPTKGKIDFWLIL